MSLMTSHLTIDAHHHVWNPEHGDYSWMTEAHALIRKVFTPDNLRPELMVTGVSRTILVQTWSSFDETVEFLKIADRTDFIAGVVGWIGLTADDAPDRLDTLLSRPEGKWLVGVRHQVHDEP